MRLLRKLGRKEAGKLTVPWGRNFSRTYRITTELDLLTRPALLNRAIRLWMKTQPLLRTKIARVDGELYFAFDERFEGEAWIQDDADLENVKYLTLDQSKIPTEVDREAFYEDLSWLVTQKELCPEFDCFNELLWRIVVLDISEPSSQNSHEFIFVLSFFHNISEGKNLHLVTLQLLDLIEFCLTKDDSVQIPKMKEFELLPSIEELYFEHFDRSTCNNERIEKLPLVFQANYVDPLEASKCAARPYVWTKALSNEWIYKLTTNGDNFTRTEFVQLCKLTEGSKSFNIKSWRLSFSEKETGLLVRRCTEQRCTVTMCLANLVSFALKKLSAQQEKPETDAQFNVTIATTLRQFEPTLPGAKVGPDFSDQLAMGYYISCTMMALDYLKNVELDKLNVSQFFWDGSRTSSEQLKAILERREVLIPLAAKTGPSGTSPSHIEVSSMGVLPAKLPDEYAYSAQTSFNIKQAHLEASVSDNLCCQDGPICLYVSTCNGRLFLSFVQNICLLTYANMEKFMGLFSDLFSQALNCNLPSYCYT